MEERFLTLQELQDLELSGEFTIEDNGMSGQFYGFHWYTIINDETGKIFQAYVK
jgi:hypothetical protein